MAEIISADEIKKTLSGYSPTKAEEFHRLSARLADKKFEALLKVGAEDQVILLNGGAASGKSEFVGTQLSAHAGIVFDTTLSTIAGAKVKFSKIRKAGKIPVIYSVIPDNLARAFTAFLSRDRKFSEEHFYRTHAGARETLLWIAENEPTIAIHIYESTYNLGQEMMFDQLKFNSRGQLLSYLRKIQLAPLAIMNKVKTEVTIP